MNFLKTLTSPFKNRSHKSRHNPDFDKPKQSVIFDVQARGAVAKTYHTRAGDVRFEGGVAVLPDDTRAEDIAGELQAEHGIHPTHKQFGVVRHRDSQKRDGIHHYKFGNWPGVPYRRYDEFGRVVKE